MGSKKQQEGPSPTVRVIPVSERTVRECIQGPRLVTSDQGRHQKHVRKYLDVYYRITNVLQMYREPLI